MAKTTEVATPGGVPEIPENTELLTLANTLETESILPESKAEQAAEAAQQDAKAAAIETTSAIVKRGLAMVAGAACAKYEALKPIWTEPVIDRIARAAAAVLLKYGIEGGEFMQKYAEEIELIMAAGEPMMVSYFIIKKAKEAEMRATGGLSNGASNGTIEPAASDTPNKPIVLA